MTGPAAAAEVEEAEEGGRGGGGLGQAPGSSDTGNGD